MTDNQEVQTTLGVRLTMLPQMDHQIYLEKKKEKHWLAQNNPVSGSVSVKCLLEISAVSCFTLNSFARLTPHVQSSYVPQVCYQVLFPLV